MPPQEPAPVEASDSGGHAERAGAAFERLTASVQARLDPGSEVRWNEKLNGRQIDATVRGKLGSASVLVVVECRDYADAIGIDHVDQLDSVRREVGANKAVLVTRTGFTRPALDKAASVGIDTCVLRPSEDLDYPGTAKPIRSMSMTIQLIGTNLESLEVELVDGRRFPCGLFYQLEGPNGEREFVDRFIKGWLQTHGRQHPNREPLHLELTPPARLLFDEEQPLVKKLHCIPDTGPSDFKVESLWQAPEEWVFVQHKPDGAVDERRFFQFPDLKALAETFKNGSKA